MLSHARHLPSHQSGITLLEVLVTVVILAFGLLGLAGMQSKMQLSTVESYQRAQAVLLLSDMSERISANINRNSAFITASFASYLTANTLGTDDTQPADCTNLPVGPTRDACEWSNSLKGAAETKSSGNVGGMTGARGCIAQIQAPNPAAGVCTPGIYLVTVAWQGQSTTKAPDASCGQNLYGEEGNRRAISARVSIGLPYCN